MVRAMIIGGVEEARGIEKCVLSREILCSGSADELDWVVLRFLVERCAFFKIFLQGISSCIILRVSESWSIHDP